MHRFKAKGYEVEVANNGHDGLAAATQKRPDVILLDIRMPDVDGLTVLSRLKDDAQTQSIPVIMCSASLVDQKDALNRGASFFVQKPFEAAVLLAAVTAISEQDAKKEEETT